ncbi:MAG: hypothetical protein JWN29_2792 [Acidimicrobiales bacterium]|nr:hypothetical protein [Acidimicrobiales bacterium]
MQQLDLGASLRASHLADPSSIPDILLRAAGRLDATDVVVYLVDFGQTTLEPVPDRSAHADVSHSEEVAASMAGRAFTDQQVTTAERPDGVRVWVPIVEGSDRTGVLALTVAAVDEEVVRGCEELGLLAGNLIATHARSTDVYNLYRRRHALSLAASMQWDLLPPLVLKTDRLSVACLLEPAYEVGGDCFDYALNDADFNIAVIDAMGHGVAAALIAALTVGSYRHDRREARSLEYIHASLDAAMASHFPEAFATGQVAQVDVDTGVMTWTNAGHPCPLLLRDGQVIRQLECQPSLPWGLGALDERSVATATESLEPGDAVLFFTDGVVEAALPGGGRFGVDRLADLAGQHASKELQPEEIVRLLVRAVIEHQDHGLADDATIVLMQWDGPTPPT